MTAGAISQAKWRKRNAVRAVNDALIELRVADRLLREAQGLPIDDALTSSRVASDPAGVQVPALAGSADDRDPARAPWLVGGPVGGAMADATPLVWPPEWQR